MSGIREIPISKMATKIAISSPGVTHSVPTAVGTKWVTPGVTEDVSSRTIRQLEPKLGGSIQDNMEIQIC